MDFEWVIPSGVPEEDLRRNLLHKIFSALYLYSMNQKIIPSHITGTGYLLLTWRKLQFKN